MFCASKSRLSAALAAALLVSLPFAATGAESAASLGRPFSGNGLTSQPATAKLVLHHVVTEALQPARALTLSLGRQRLIGIGEDTDQARLLRHKANAAHNPFAPFAERLLSNDALGNFAVPPPRASFGGMTNSTSICPPAGCAPPDQALLVSPSWVVQSVNMSVAVYNPSGALQAGWPKDFQSFFNAPVWCPGQEDFIFDPRGFYDVGTGHFWIAALDAGGCAQGFLYWIAVSQTGNPNGKWNAYAYDITQGAPASPDYPAIGYDIAAVYFEATMFASGGTYSSVFAADKVVMTANGNAPARGFTKLAYNGINLDTVQPVESKTRVSDGPTTEYLVNSFNMHFGGGSCSSSCSGQVVWAYDNALSLGPQLHGIVVATGTYTLAPSANEPGCTQCVETIDTRISGSPVYQNGLISWALETGINNGSQVVPGIFWGQTRVSNNNMNLKGSLFQSGHVAYAGDRAASFGTLMPDAAGNLLMVWDSMGSTRFPGIFYGTRLATDPLGSFTGSRVLIQGKKSTQDGRWGDYEATSFDGTTSNNIWFSSQYTSPSLAWTTQIAKIHF